MSDTLSQQEVGAQVQRGGAHLAGDVEYTFVKDRVEKQIWIFFQLKCCQLSHAMSRGWTLAAFPWQAALKAAHAASQIVLGSCISSPHQVFGFPACRCWCLLTGKQQDVLRFGLSELLPHADKPSLETSRNHGFVYV